MTTKVCHLCPPMKDYICPHMLALDHNEPLYWIFQYAEGYQLDTGGSPVPELIAYRSNNDDRYRWCSYDSKGKEYVEWDSANVDTSTLVSSVQSVEKPPLYLQMEDLMRGWAKEDRLRVLRLTLAVEMVGLTSKRSKKLQNQLHKFDAAAALELSE